MPIKKGTPKPRKTLDPDVLRKRVERAVKTLKNSVLIAMREKLILPSQWSALNNELNVVDCGLTMSFQPPIEASKSEARLPF